MSMSHVGPVTQKPISEIAKYIKSLIPANIPEAYALKPMFESVANEDNIRNGVIAFRDFLYLFCDNLISQGHLYSKPQSKPKSATDYPFLYHITDLLADIGYYGELSKKGDSLLVTKLPSFITSMDEKGSIKKPRNPVSKLTECFRFLTLCGFAFSGIDLEAKTLTSSRLSMIEVSYPNAPALPTGLKALSIADIELRTKRYISDNNHDNLLRCDYRLIKKEDTDTLELLKEFLQPLPEEVQNLALSLHHRHTDMGMNCVAIISTFDVHFAYSFTKKSRRVLSSRDVYQNRLWEFALTTKNDYSLVIRAKNINKYMNVIEAFPSFLQEKVTMGYGCDRKLRNEPCQGGCQGLRFPLNGSLLDIKNDIEALLDKEVSFIKK